MTISIDDLKLGTRFLLKKDCNKYPSRIIGVEPILTNGNMWMAWFVIATEYTITEELSPIYFQDLKRDFPFVKWIENMNPYIGCNFLWLKQTSSEPIEKFIFAIIK